MVDAFGNFIPQSPSNPPPIEMFAPRSPSGTPPPLSPVYTTDTPLQLSPYDESLGEYPSPEYASAEPPVMGGGGGGYQQGALVCRRGVSPTDTNNVWQVKNMGPEFTTIVRHGNGAAFGGEEILVVDNNEIFPYQGMPTYTTQYPSQMSDPFLTENLLAREQPMVNPYKQPDVNVVVVTGDKNELNGMPVSSGSSNSSQSPIQGGSSTVSQPVSQEADKKENIPATADKKGGGVLDFLTGGFLIKKTG